MTEADATWASVTILGATPPVAYVAFGPGTHVQK